jgi:GSH-dependent disulfide-bond oxidoreductase
MMGQLWHFKVFAPEKILSAINRYEREVKRLFKVLDGQLATPNYLVDDYGIADIASWPWIHAHSELALNLGACPDLKRWHDAIAGRSAVQRGLRVPAEREINQAA